MIDWGALETPLDEKPLFPVQEPDGRKNEAELPRCVMFLRLMRTFAPRCIVYANSNAGRRNPLQARREGIVAGVFDYTVVWTPESHLLIAGVAWVEMKGYSKAGTAGKLSQAQIDFGNALHRAGHLCAAFFDPVAAVNWLRSIGAPVREVVG